VCSEERVHIKLQTSNFKLQTANFGPHHFSTLK
jgi:hypothetical protein